MHTIKIGNIKLEVVDSNDSRVPKEATAIKMSKIDLSAIALAHKNNLACLLIGETGTGKTSIVRWLASQIKAPYVRVNMSGFTTPDELIGSKSIKDGETYYERGVITDAMQAGAILVIDEINATSPDCLFILHGLLDDDQQITLPNGDIIKPSKGFRVYATANPDYAGTKGFNQALLDRFPLIIEVDTLPRANEISLLVNRTGVARDLAVKLVEVATQLRRDYKAEKLTSYISTRALLNVSRLIGEGWEGANAFKVVIVNKTRLTDEKAVMSDVFNIVWKISPEEINRIDYLEITREESDRNKQAKARQEEIASELEELKSDLNILRSDLDSAEKRLKLKDDIEVKLQAKLDLAEKENEALITVKKMIASLKN